MLYSRACQAGSWLIELVVEISLNAAQPCVHAVVEINYANASLAIRGETGSPIRSPIRLHPRGVLHGHRINGGGEKMEAVWIF